MQARWSALGRDGTSRADGGLRASPVKAAEAIALAVLLAVALAARLQKIDQPPFDFATIRQYRGLMIARACYYETAGGLPEWKKRNAALDRERLGVLEPTVLETLACTAYRIGGGERMWVGRVFSTVFWVLGGLLLARLAHAHVAPDAALVATGYYLFLPFGFLASRSFQPDSLMVLLFIASVLAIARYDRVPSAGRLAVATLVSAAAIFVKPTCLFAIVGAFLALAVRRMGLRRALADRSVLIFACVALAPAVLYTAYHVAFPSALRGQARKSFVPHLWFAASFWAGWLNQIARVIGLPALALSAAGVVIARGRARLLLAGLWAGYFVFGMAFPYHIHTHAYYQLQLIPIVALSLGALATPLIRRLAGSRAATIALGGVAAVAIAAALRTASARTGSTGAAERLRTYGEIGGLVSHSAKTVQLSRDGGRPLRFHGEVSGWKWPAGNDMRASSLLGLDVPSAAPRLRELVEREGAEFFIVTRLEELDAQRDLKQILETGYPKLAETERYVIFDLAHPLAPPDDSGPRE